jgi:pteridine reductase
MFRAVRKAFGRVDVLVNNAAVFHRTPIETLTADQWDLEMTVNARAPALCIRHVIPLMKRRGGAVINIADIQAERALPSYPAYCASKAALLALTQSAARALARHGIRVNAVSPGVALWPEGKTGKERKTVLAKIPLGRPGSPEEIAQAVLFLAQHEYVTGQNLRVDGGWSLV